ncbi:DEAD box ATP-dependent RNA helicase, putative [Plasmodium malariae]|uniref:ATP-dependent RNA helicase n=1 Tax=Plasmodium malariae TaxID=5858 RepID=A0A1C3KA40_PLAMA|nr:DEAD box ATP-dependent RNA helicase, putative [Plasmodium malariae]
MVSVENVKNLVKLCRIFQNVKISLRVESGRSSCFLGNVATDVASTAVTVGTPMSGTITAAITAASGTTTPIANIVKEKESKSEAEENYLAEFVNGGKKIIYDNMNDLNALCLTKLKKLKADVHILTSSNREYVPYYFYDFFLSHYSFQSNYNNCLDKIEALKKMNDSIGNNEIKAEQIIGNNFFFCSSEDNTFIIKNRKLIIYDKKEEKTHIYCNREAAQKGIFIHSNYDKYAPDALCTTTDKCSTHYDKAVLHYNEVNHMNIDSFIKLSLEKNFRMKYVTTVQYCLFPFFLKNFDVLVHSFKGTGKTLAYCIPLLHKIIVQINNLKRNCTIIKENYVLALVVCPNIILVEQTYAIIKKLIMYHPCNIICHYIHGRKNMNMQDEINELKKKKPHVIVTTPVSFINHIKFSTNFSRMFFLCDTLIIDEAYFLLNPNYLKNILIIKNVLPKGHQTILLTCLVNNFLKHLAYRFLRLNYVHLNFVDNCIYDSNIFHAAALMNIINFNSNEKLNYINYISKNKNSRLFQLHHELNAKLITMYRHNILNCDDLGKLWHCKDATTFYQNVNAFNSYIVNSSVRSSSDKQLDFQNDFLAGHKSGNKSISINSSRSGNISSSSCSAKVDIGQGEQSKEHLGNDAPDGKGKNSNTEHRVNEKNNLNLCDKRNELMDENNSKINTKRKIKRRTEEITEEITEEFIYRGTQNDEKIKKLKLNNSDYNNYTVYSKNCVKYEENKGKNIPTHIFLKQEYLIYESDKLALILFNIICKELLSNDNINIVIFMPTVKMVQFFYVIFKHYIFKGYIFLLYLKLNNSLKKKNLFFISHYYDKENVNFSVSSDPFVSIDHVLPNSSIENSKKGVNDLDKGKDSFCHFSEEIYAKCSKSSEQSEIQSDCLNEQNEYKLQDEEEFCYEKGGENNTIYQKEYEQLKDILISCLHSKLSLDKKIYTLNNFNNSEKKKKILFSTSMVCQGIEIDNVDLVIQIGVCASIDEYILRTNIATTKAMQGRSLLLLNELEGHYLFILYKNNIIISSISKNYLNYIYKENNLLYTLLKYKRRNKNVSENSLQKSNYITNNLIKVKKEDNNYDYNLEGEQIKLCNEELQNYGDNIDKGETFNFFYNSQIRHVEWHKHNHLLCSCELMYRSLLGFYCEKNENFKFEKWQVPSLIKNIIYSFGYFENFYITKSMAARLQVLNAPDVYIKFHAKSKSVLMSALPSYKGYKSRINELNHKCYAGGSSTRSSMNSSMSNSSNNVIYNGKESTSTESYNGSGISLGHTRVNRTILEENSRMMDEYTKGEKCKKTFLKKCPLYFPIQKYLL